MLLLDLYILTRLTRRVKGFRKKFSGDFGAIWVPGV